MLNNGTACTLLPIPPALGAASIPGSFVRSRGAGLSTRRMFWITPQPAQTCGADAATGAATSVAAAPTATSAAAPAIAAHRTKLPRLVMEWAQLAINVQTTRERRRRQQERTGPAFVVGLPRAGAGGREPHTRRPCRSATGHRRSTTAGNDAYIIEIP